MYQLSRAQKWVGVDVRFSKQHKGGRRMVEQGVQVGRVVNVRYVKAKPGGDDFILYSIQFGPNWSTKISDFRREDFYPEPDKDELIISGNGSQPPAS